MIMKSWIGFKSKTEMDSLMHRKKQTNKKKNMENNRILEPKVLLQ